MLVEAKNLKKRYTDRNVLDDVSFTVDEGERVGLVGVNGTGKSTLFKILAGLETSEGTVIKKKGLRMHYVSQSPVFTHKTVLEEMRAHAAKQPEPIESYEVSSILNQLGLQDGSIDELSGGQKKRLALARALITKCDLLLLDEPTNHLDMAMIDMLENRLLKNGQAVFMITHDRWFLDRVCTRILELDNGKLYGHAGGYETYVKDKEERLAAEQSAAHKLDRLYKKELEWVRAGVQARSTKSQSRLDAFERLRDARHKKQEKKLLLQAPSARLGKKTLSWENISFGYDRPLFADFSYVMKRRERLGIIGPNGYGKSTLFKVLAGKLKPDSGVVETGPTVRVGWFGQEEQADDLSVRVIDFVSEKAQLVDVNGQAVSASSMLERFLIPKSMQYMPLERLSGGERRRVYLLRVLMGAPNVLFLDEPTNDLDLVTLAVLEDYLDDFEGLVLTVSHDRYFMDRVCDSVFVFEDGRLRQYMGGYSDYLEKRQQVRTAQRQEKSRPQRTRKPKLSYMEKKELDELPDQLEALEAEVDELNARMGDVKNFGELREITDRRDQLANELELKTARWMELEEKREA